MIKAKVQKMFPNCAKYSHCCDESKDIKVTDDIDKDIELLTKKTMKEIDLEEVKTPEGFNGW